MTLLMSVDPSAIERARRLECAIRLLRMGLSRTEVTQYVRAEYRVHNTTAWRTVTMAADLVDGR